MSSLDNWFIYSLTFVDDVPKIRMNLLTNKISKGLSPANIDYFEFHVEDKEMAHKLHEFRKQFFNIQKLINHMLEIEVITYDVYIKAAKFLELKFNAGRIEQQKAMSSPDVLAKIRSTNKRTAKSRGLKVAARWASADGREKYLAAIRDENVIKRRIETFKETITKNYDDYIRAMRTPSRCLKIGLAASEMWKRKSLEGKMRMRPLPGKRSHIINGKKMNLPESMIAKWLSDKKIGWEYEKPFHSDEVTYYPDFYISQSHTVIQHYGDFWHANPSKYNSTDILFENYTAADKWSSDHEYEQALQDKWNLKVIVVWESDLMNNTNTVFERLAKELHND